MKTLDELGRHHGTDKVSHGYLPHYEKRFAGLRKEAVTVLEIGVAGGASLRMWRDYFERGIIHGVDCDSGAAVFEHRMTTWVGRQEDAGLMDAVGSGTGPIDIIIDDGSHCAKDHLASFKVLWHHLKVGGWYCIEDCFTLFTPKWTRPEEDTIIHYLFRRHGHILTGQDDIGEVDIIGNQACDGLVLIRKTAMRFPHSAPFQTFLHQE
jgi:hypothetical protein